jgi:hypothetical protein
VNLTNFLVTKCTSPLTLQVLGNAKGAVAVVVSIILFKNPVSGVGMVGYGVTVAGVVAYSEAKKRGKEAAAKRMGRGASSGVLELLGNEGEKDRQRSGSKLSTMA